MYAERQAMCNFYHFLNITPGDYKHAFTLDICYVLCLLDRDDFDLCWIYRQTPVHHHSLFKA